MKDFNELALPESLKHTLQHMKFDKPTPIQAEAIPLALSGRDILGTAQTGTGKTGAFGIPLVAKLLQDPNSTALVLTPTRELAAQVMGQLKQMLGQRSKIKGALLIGGETMTRQLNQLQLHPRLIVGTPGRINDHLTRKSLNLKQANFLVLDETDRMLDMGFTVQIEKILSFMPKERQTMLFSATLPKSIEKIAKSYLLDPVRIAVNPNSSPAENITHKVLMVNEREKFDKLLDELNDRKGTVILFVKTKYGTERMAKKLVASGHVAEALHGDLRQSRRDRVILAFREEKFRILVATDVAARGLDIPHIEHVINFDLPQVAEDYIHRIGRTARAGAKGSAIGFVTEGEIDKWNAILRLMDPTAVIKDVPKNKKSSPRTNAKKKLTSGRNPGENHKPKKRKPFLARVKMNKKPGKKPSNH